MDCDVLKSAEALIYISTCHRIKHFITRKEKIPNDVWKEHEKSIKEYRQYLEEKRIRMRPALFPYDPDDKTTWKYINLQTDGQKYKGATLNSEWKHENLVKRIKRL